MTQNNGKVTGSDSVRAIADDNDHTPFSNDMAMALINSGEQFPVDFDAAWRWLMFATKASAKRKLANFLEGVDFSTSWLNNTKGRPSEKIMLTVDCFKSLGMMAGTEQGKQIRKYFLDCERTVKAKASKVNPPSSMDVLTESLKALVQVAQSMAEVERVQRSQGVVLDRLVGNQKKAEQELKSIPLSEQAPADLPIRARINMLVRNAVYRNNVEYKVIWNKLYAELYYRYSFNVKVRCKNSGRKPLDEIEANGLLEALYAIASEVLV